MDFKKYKMKKTLFILFSLLIAGSIYSQGNNLQFNQVINQDFTTLGNGQNWHNAGTISVSTNKILKITSFMGYRGNDSFDYFKAKIGNMLVYLGTSVEIFKADTPIWLSSGNHIVYLRGYSSSSQDLKFSISGVEFNIVQ